MKIHATQHTSRITRLAEKTTHYLKAKLLTILLALPVLASADNTHYIIAFDQSVGNYRSYYQTPKILSTLTSVLKSADFNPDNDYLSMVAYTLECGKPSMERFVRPYVTSTGDTVKWMKLKDVDLLPLFRNWPQGQPLLSPEGAPYGSMQSLAKPYVVMETLTGANSDSHATRTIMLMVTDGKVNGTDDNYSQEWNRMRSLPGSDEPKFDSIKSGVFSTLQNFNEEFKFVEVPLGKNNATRFRISPVGNYLVIPYEVVSADKPSIHSVTDFPSSLPLQRIRGGFKLAVEAKTIEPKYEIHQISIYKQDGTLLGEVADGNFVLILPSDEVLMGDTLTVSMALRLNDGFYNGTLVSGDNPRYKAGMESKQMVKIPDEAKVLGLFPLADAFWWWSPNDVFTAVMIWDIVISITLIILLTLFVMWMIKKLATYRPASKSITIRPVRLSK